MISRVVLFDIEKEEIVTQSHDNRPRVWNGLLDVLVWQNHRLIDKYFILDLDILSDDADTLDAHPVPNHVLPAYDGVPNEDVPFDFGLRQDS